MEIIKVFWIASIPAIIAFSILLFIVKEPKQFDHPAVSSEVPLPAPKRRQRIQISQFHLLGQAFWLLMAVNAILCYPVWGDLSYFACS